MPWKCDTQNKGIFKRTTNKNCDDGSSIMEIHIVEKEQWWIGVVLSQGKEVEIIEPEHIKERIINSAKDILFLYDKL